MKQLSIILSLLLSYSLHGQICNCPNSALSNEEMKPIKVFTFKHNKQIGVCGYHELKNKITTYSEFVCYECGKNKIIDMWDATEDCIIEKKGDTLYIKQVYELPIGRNFEDVPTPFHIYKLYYSHNEITEECFYRKDIPLYTKKQIEEVINRFYHLKKENSEVNLNEGYMLFWAFVSGSKEAENCFKQMETKYGPYDGVIKELWNFIFYTYNNYKSGLTSVKHIYFNEKYN